jgi:hypothetical protein
MISEATDAPRCVWSSARPSLNMGRVYGWMVNYTLSGTERSWEG